MAGFQYRPLEAAQTRILIIFPGQTDSIYCGLVHADPKEFEHQYVALSYVWGDPSLPKSTIKLAYYRPEIQQNPESSQHFTDFEITPSLESALRTFRADRPRLPLWVDAVCINQTDKSEKEREIARMAQIYSQASTVLVWLGSPQESDDMPCEENRDGEAIHAAFDWCLRLPDQLITGNDSINDLHFNNRELLPERAAFLGFAILCQRPWFKRVWVIQEVTLATGDTWMLCGRHSIALKLFMSSARFMSRFSKSLSKFDESISPVLDFHTVFQVFKSSEFSRAPLSERLVQALFSTTGVFEATVYHDRVYGMLGMIGSVQDVPALRPDYKKSQEAFLQDLARYLIDATGTLTILETCKPDDAGGLPSWVPTWKCKVPPILGISPRAREFTSYHFSDCGRRLRMRASALGQIRTIYQLRAEMVNDPLALRNRLWEIEHAILMARGSAARQALELDDSLGVALDKFATADEHGGYLQLYNNFTRRATAPSRSAESTVGEEPGEQRLLKLLKVAFTPDLNVLITSSGHVTRTWNEVVQSDSLYLVPGCRWPMAFRRESIGLSIVGACNWSNLDVITTDEHFETLKNGDWEDIIIV